MEQAAELVYINKEQVKRVAEVIKHCTEIQPSNYASHHHPPVDHPFALDYFFAVTLQQFGFWEDDGKKYVRPMIAQLDREELKGSAYMAKAYFSLLDKDPQFYSPARQAKLQKSELVKVLKSDSGHDHLPALDLHLSLANNYGQDMLDLGLSPLTIIASVNTEEKPLHAFLQQLSSISGYKEDPLGKKANLLAMILIQRPERFLKIGSDESFKPIVDYHCMRASLRLGLIEVIDSALSGKLSRRHLVKPEEEWAVRLAAYQIQPMLEEFSGKPIGVINQFFFNYMRGCCHEMRAPECSRCIADLVCLHRKQYFQPVLRTTNY